MLKKVEYYVNRSEMIKDIHTNIQQMSYGAMNK